VERESMGWSRYAGRLGLALAGVLIALLLAEGALRIRSGAGSGQGLRSLHEVRPDRPWIFGLRPGARSRISATGDVLYEVNADGFRGPLRTAAKPPGVFRVVVLGDSVAFGYGVAEADSFVRRMEALLSEAQPVEVLNFGVGGYNPYNEAAQFADLGVAYAPDLVLVAFCINDLNDPTLHFDAQTRLHLGTIPDAAYPDPSLRHGRYALPAGWLRPCRGLQLCALFDDAWLALHEAPVDARLQQATFALRDLSSLPIRRWLAERYGEIAERAAAIDAHFAVLVFPYRDQVEGRASARAQAQLAALGEREGWPTIDLLPAFRRAAAEGSGPLFRDIWHPTAEGHRVAAEASVAGLAQLRWLPTAGGR
jgi:lysophospholipase L1-like esterase